MEKKVLCFGEVLWDTFADGKKAGGAPLNVALHLAQQQVDVKMASRIGTDQSGQELAGVVQQQGLNTDLLQHDDDLPTCEVTVTLDAYNQASYSIPQPVAWDNIKPTRHLIDAAKNADAIVFGSLANRNETTRNTLYTLLDESNALPVFDVNLRTPHYEITAVQALAARARVIKMNEEEAELLLDGDLSTDLQQRINEFKHTYHHQTIIITRGAHGAMVWHNDAFFEHPGATVQVADTVGAGDSFLATLVAGLLRNEAIDQVLDRACRVGAFVASQRGANPKYVEGLV